MADSPQKLQLAFEQFARDFALPVAQGGTLHLGAPIGPAALDHFMHARPSDTLVEQRLYEAWLKRAADVVPVRSLPFPEPDAIALLLALYDMLVVTDPRLCGWPARAARPKVLAWVDSLVARAGPPPTRESALARHAAVGRVLEVARDDLLVRTWAYTHRFAGRRPPPRLLAWKGLRRVHEDVSRVPADQLLGFSFPQEDAVEPADAWLAAQLPPRVAALLAATPITDVLTCARKTPAFTFGPASTAALADPAIRTGVAQTLLVAGLDRAVVPLGNALLAMANAPAPPAAVGVVMRFLYELHVLAVVDRGESDKEPPVERMSPPAAAMLAVLPAIAVAGGGFADEIPLERADEAELRVRSALLARMAGDEMIRWATALVGYAAGGPAPSSPLAPAPAPPSASPEAPPTTAPDTTSAPATPATPST